MTAGIDRRYVPDFAPPDIAAFDPFWAAAARGAVAMPACPQCGRIDWYPLPALSCGHAAQPEWIDMPGTGVLHTWSRVHRSFLPTGGNPPHTVILVDLDGAPGVRLVSVLVGPGSESPRIGARVRVEPIERTAFTLPAFVLA
jgi:uncharacterized protein